MNNPRDELVLLLLHDGEIGVIDLYTLTHEPLALVWYESGGQIHDRPIDCRRVVTLEDAVRRNKDRSLRNKEQAEECIAEHKGRLSELGSSISFLDHHKIGNNFVDKYEELLDFRGNSSRLSKRGVSDGDVVIQEEYVGLLYDRRVTRTPLTRKVSWADNDTSGGVKMTKKTRWIRDDAQAKEVRKMLRSSMLKHILRIRSERLRIALAEKEIDSMKKYETGEKPKILRIMEASIESRKKEQELRRKKKELA